MGTALTDRTGPGLNWTGAWFVEDMFLNETTKIKFNEHNCGRQTHRTVDRAAAVGWAV